MTDANRSIDAYIAKQTPDAQVVLNRVRAIIRKALPDAEERISYQIPCFRLHDSNVVFFAGWKQHWSLYPVTEPVRKELGEAVAGYEISKGTVRFALDAPVPTRLVQRIVKALANAAEARRRERPAPRVRKAARPSTSRAPRTPQKPRAPRKRR
jgi:uncharacterized protein YdhG (YjbR/CyaY superfamily)